MRVYEEGDEYVVEAGADDGTGKCYISFLGQKIRAPCIRIRVPRPGCKAAKVAFAASCAYAASRTGRPELAAACAAAVIAWPPCDSEEQADRRRTIAAPRGV